MNNIVQNMNDFRNKENNLNVLRKVVKNPHTNQRQLALDLGFSLGKLNYCLKALKEKGLIKIRNFTKSSKKLDYVYIITPRGLAEKTKLTIDFMQKKIAEYDELKREIE